MKKKSLVCLVTAVLMACAMIPSTAFAGLNLTTDFQNSTVSYGNQSVARTPLTVEVTNGLPDATYTYVWYGVPTKTYYRGADTLLATHSNRPNTDSFTPLSNAGSMYYYVQVTDNMGNQSQVYTRETAGPYVHVKITPNPPSGIKVKNVNSYTNYITWTGIRGDFPEYQLYRSCKYYSWKQCALGTGATYYKDYCGGMVPGVTYYYKIRSRVRFDGQSSYTYSTDSPAYSVKYKLPASKVTKLSKKSRTSIKVYWSKVSDATGYKIYQKAGKGKWKCIKTIKSYKTLSYTKKSLKKGKKYYYKIRAYKTYGGHTGYAAYSSSKSKKL
jgi:hypothetical protein